MNNGDITEFTTAPLRLESIIEFSNIKADTVFEILGDPLKICDWYLLAKQVHLHPGGDQTSQNFDVEFTFFGKVEEQILYWDPPHKYIYQATGEQFPIKDYVSSIEVVSTEPLEGTLHWNIYFSEIEGQEFERILPVMLPAVNHASMKKLATLIGGQSVECKAYFDQ